MYENLRFRRQFLLTQAPIEPLAQWNSLQIGDYHLYSHPDVDVNHASDTTKRIVLIGEIFDPESPGKGDAEILRDILQDASDRLEIVRRVKRYVGIYALLYLDESEIYLQNDPLALKEIYYCADENIVVCGSQPNLVAKFAKPGIAATRNPEIRDFYENHLTASKWVGDTTYYDGVFHLLPNHCLDVRTRRSRRYWPNEPIKRITLDEAVHKSCAHLQGALKAIAHRHELMMAVTAGTDSRTLLAASREISDRIYYFINNQGLDRNYPDIAIPTKIFSHIGVQFHVHDVPNEVDPDFRETFLSNSFFATDRILPTIYNIYYRNLGDKCNILGIGEIGRSRYGKQPARLNNYRIAYKLGYKEDCGYVAKQSEIILNELEPVAEKYKINALTLLYWEQMLGNWGAVGNSESDIAIEEIDPYDSHALYEIFLGVDERYTRYKESPCILFREMILAMWPELLNWPINPPYTLRANLYGLLTKAGIFGILKELKYRLYYFSHILKLR